MPQFRKKPVVIEAWQFSSKTPLEAQPEWLKQALRTGIVVHVVSGNGDQPFMKIYTLEGEMIASVDDWIIQGVKHEIYPCKPDIFAATYEAVE